MLNEEFIHNRYDYDKLENTLARLAVGVPSENILTDASSDFEWLKPMLEVSLEVSELRQAVPIPPPDASLQRLLSYGEALAATSETSRFTDSDKGSWLLELFSHRRGIRFAFGLVTALLVAIILSGVLHSVAQASLPGEPLYQIKRFEESLQLYLTQDEAQREHLLKNFNLRRQTETKQLLELGQQANVLFEGNVEALTTISVTIDGLWVQLSSDTEMPDNLIIGTRVQFEGETQLSGQLNALSIEMLELPPPTPIPSPTKVNIVTPTPTLVKIPVLLPSETSTPKPTPTATPVIEPVAINTPTVIPAPSPTAVFVETVPEDKDPPDNEVQDEDEDDANDIGDEFDDSEFEDSDDYIEHFDDNPDDNSNEDDDLDDTDNGIEDFDDEFEEEPEEEDEDDDDNSDSGNKDDDDDDNS